MKDNKYKRVVMNFKADKNMEGRLKQAILKSKPGNYSKRFIYIKAAALIALTCIFVIISFVGLPLLLATEGTNNPNYVNSSDITNQPLVKNSIFSGFTMVAYAAEAEGKSLTENYNEETIPTLLEPKIEVLLPMYSPLMSSVPGLPFTIGFKEAKENEYVADEIRISVDKGTFNTWNVSDFIVKDKGKTVSFIDKETIYWSPIGEINNSEITVGDTIITVTAVKDGQEIGSQTITIIQNEEFGNYAAVLGEFIYK